MLFRSVDIFKEIMRDYGRMKSEASRLQAIRQAEVYEKIPRVKELDELMNRTGFEITKAILSNAQSQDEKNILIENLKQKNAELQDEKMKLIKKYKYPNDYLLNVYKCIKCKDTGFVGTEKCTCLRQKLMQRYYTMSNLTNSLEAENFDTFDYRYFSKEISAGEKVSPYSRIMDIYQASSQFVNNFNEEFSNFLFYGKTGLGKTFMCNCIAKDLLDKGNTVLYVTAAQLFKTVTDYHFKKDEAEEMRSHDLIEFIYSVDLLIIDDLGTEFSTVVTSSEFFNFINTRLLEKRHTIISTNLVPKDFRNIYSDRVTSRILGHYIAFNFLGMDIRLQKKYSRFN